MELPADNRADQRLAEYGVSKRYKESANCRLEANYAMQQE